MDPRASKPHAKEQAVENDGYRPDIEQFLPPNPLPDPKRVDRWCEPFRIDLLAGQDFVFETRVIPQYYLVADASGASFDVCYGPSFIPAKSVPVGVGGRVKLPGTNSFLSLRAGAGAVTVLILALSGYPETDYLRQSI